MRYLALLLLSLPFSSFSQRGYAVGYSSWHFSASGFSRFNHYATAEGYMPAGAFMPQKINFTIGGIAGVASSKDSIPQWNAYFNAGFTPNLGSYVQGQYRLSHIGWNFVFSPWCYDLLGRKKNIDLLLSAGIHFGQNYLKIADESSSGKYVNSFCSPFLQCSFRACLFKKLVLNPFARYSFDLSRPIYKHRSGGEYYIGGYKHTGIEFGIEIGRTTF